MAESRFERWSRLKREAQIEVVEDHAPEGEVVDQPEEEQELAVNEQLSDAEVLAKYDLPDPDVIELGMDIKGFLRSEIPEALRRRALRSLWRSNPVLAVLDGLNDYDEDFSIVRASPGGVKTLYQVGKGMFDKVKRAEERLAELAGESSEIQAIEASVINPVRLPDIADLSQTALSREDEGGLDAPASVESVDAAEVDRVYEAESVETSPFRYRPRMSFD